jgi:hypothetical protein
MTSQTPKKIKKKGWLILAIAVVLLIIAVVVWQTGTAKKSVNPEIAKNADTT